VKELNKTMMLRDPAVQKGVQQEEKSEENATEI
jgi:hypothetical protein